MSLRCQLATDQESFRDHHADGHLVARHTVFVSPGPTADHVADQLIPGCAGVATAESGAVVGGEVQPEVGVVRVSCGTDGLEGAAAAPEVRVVLIGVVSAIPGAAPVAIIDRQSCTAWSFSQATSDVRAWGSISVVLRSVRRW